MTEHEMDCGDALEQMYLFLDNEMDEEDCARVRQHLADCEPCLEQYDLEGLVKSVVHRSCGSDRPPEDLRQRVLSRIREAQAQANDTTQVNGAT